MLWSSGDKVIVDKMKLNVKIRDFNHNSYNGEGCCSKIYADEAPGVP